MKNRQLAIITGASSGIGLACAEKFAEGGWDLILIARRAEKLKLISTRLEKSFNVRVHAIELDVTQRESGDLLANYVTDNGLQPHLLLNNAGLAVGIDPIHEGRTDDWGRMIDTNVKGLLYITRAIAPIFVEQSFGHIINIGSIAGKEAYPGGNVYCATKFAVDGLTRAIRMDLVSHGIRVTQVAPGAVETEFSVVRFKGDHQRAEKVYIGFQPLSPQDVADAVWYCANVPKHVNINDMVIMPTAQASAGLIHKNL
ncbi:MAG: NAD(P)-dependent oxidoreductase [Bacteroidetes bacterium HGW-Bacteroidetes-1]|jgi:NADP-dependent 3-hydroxy acid dehydrogenase YdfG|nr:MAG: NAD(P)-dependent oxidoreductase [Bacteroidetes bacterium HGW-Bacteroidetes-1]